VKNNLDSEILFIFIKNFLDSETFLKSGRTEQIFSKHNFAIDACLPQCVTTG